jgi:hypothetical protein
MGIRSDVGLALRKNVTIPTAVQVQLDVLCTKRLFHQEGTLLLFKNIKWDPFYVDVDLFLRWLQEDVDNQDYLLVEACFDYPDPDAISGDWYDNPWNLTTHISVELRYDEEDE